MSLIGMWAKGNTIHSSNYTSQLITCAPVADAILFGQSFDFPHFERKWIIYGAKMASRPGHQIQLNKSSAFRCDGFVVRCEILAARSFGENVQAICKDNINDSNVAKKMDQVVWHNGASPAPSCWSDNSLSHLDLIKRYLFMMRVPTVCGVEFSGRYR